MEAARELGGLMQMKMVKSERLLRIGNVLNSLHQ